MRGIYGLLTNGDIVGKLVRALVLAAAVALACASVAQALDQTPAQVQYGGGQAGEVLSTSSDSATDPADPSDPGDPGGTGDPDGTGATPDVLPATGGSPLFLTGLVALALTGGGALVLRQAVSRR